MAACDVNSITRDAGCFFCIPGGLQYPLKLALLCRWWKLLAPNADCSVNALMADAKCFACLSPGEQQILKLALLCRILGGGAGPVAPDALTQVQCDSVGGISPQLSWTNGSKPQTSIEAWANVNGAGYSLAQVLAPTATNYIGTPVINPGDSTCIKVRACNGSLCTAFTIECCVNF